MTATRTTASRDVRRIIESPHYTHAVRRAIAPRPRADRNNGGCVARRVSKRRAPHLLASRFVVFRSFTYAALLAAVGFQPMAGLVCLTSCRTQAWHLRAELPTEHCTQPPSQPRGNDSDQGCADCGDHRSGQLPDPFCGVATAPAVEQQSGAPLMHGARLDIAHADEAAVERLAPALRETASPLRTPLRSLPLRV